MPTTRIADGPAAKAWLARMPQPVTVDNLAEITRVLEALGARGTDPIPAALAPQRKFAIADRIRGVLMPTIGERAREDRFAVLPLDDDFSRHFWTAINAAIALRDVYAWLVSQLPEAPAAGDANDASLGEALDGAAVSHTFVSRVGALHRALDVSAYLLVCVQRARWAVPPVLWDRHCVLGQLVRDLDCQDIEVADALRISATKTCRSAFVLPLMIALADPAARSATEFEMIRMAAQRWSAKVGFRLEKRQDGSAMPPRPVANPGPTITLGTCVLRFDTQSALQSIDKRLDALAEGMSPREVGIGDSLKPQAARELLASLRMRWSARAPAELDSPERTWRASADPAPVQAMVGLPTEEARLRRSQQGLGVDARAAQSPYSYQRMKSEAITQTRHRMDEERIERLLEGAEIWTLAAEAPDAVRCVRKHARPRIGLQRLVGLKLGSSDHASPFLLGWVEALQASTTMLDDQRLRPSVAHTVRVRLAPGVPQVIRASIDDVEVERAFLLVPAVDADAKTKGTFVPMLTDVHLGGVALADDGDDWTSVRASPRSYGLVLPHATFRPQRLVKAVRRGAVATLRLEELMMRGSDFDLVRFIPL